MTKLSERLEALAEKATIMSLQPEDTSEDVASARFEIRALLEANFYTIIEALKAKDL